MKERLCKSVKPIKMMVRESLLDLQRLAMMRITITLWWNPPR